MKILLIHVAEYVRTPPKQKTARAGSAAVCFLAFTCRLFAYCLLLWWLYVSLVDYLCIAFTVREVL